MNTEATCASETSKRIHSITHNKILTCTCNRNLSKAHSQTPFLNYFLWLITQRTLWKTAFYRITAATLIDVLCFEYMCHKAVVCCTHDKQISTSPSRITPAALTRGVIWCTDCSTNKWRGKSYRRFSCINTVLSDRLRDGNWKAWGLLGIPLLSYEVYGDNRHDNTVLLAMRRTLGNNGSASHKMFVWELTWKEDMQYWCKDMANLGNHLTIISLPGYIRGTVTWKWTNFHAVLI